MWKEVKCKFNKDIIKFLSYIDPNKSHSVPRNGKGIDGSISGMYLVQDVIFRTWSDDVFCADDISIQFIKAMYLDEEYILFYNKTYNLDKVVIKYRYERLSDNLLMAKGIITQKLKKK